MVGFLIDQQLPRALSHYLTSLGHDGKHIKDYPGGTTMPDALVAQIADTEHRLVVTKDEDFRASHLLSKQPLRLLHFTCGSSSTNDLLTLFHQHRAGLDVAIATYNYIEIDRPGIIIHDVS